MTGCAGEKLLTFFDEVPGSGGVGLGGLGGTQPTAGASAGGISTSTLPGGGGLGGGTASGGDTTGGRPSGGISSGGVSSGGVSSGGIRTGGFPSGGFPSGGSSAGGTATGATGGRPTGGAGGVTGCPAPISVQYTTYFKTTVAEQIQPTLLLRNDGAVAVPLSLIKLRYWFTAEGAAPAAFCNFADNGCTTIGMRFGVASAPLADTYVEIAFASGTLAPQTTTELEVRVQRSDWGDYTQTNDYSFGPTLPRFSPWERIGLYCAGRLVSGVEP